MGGWRCGGDEEGHPGEEDADEKPFTKEGLKKKLWGDFRKKKHSAHCPAAAWHSASLEPRQARRLRPTVEEIRRALAKVRRPMRQVRRTETEELPIRPLRSSKDGPRCIVLPLFTKLDGTIAIGDGFSQAEFWTGT
jgi:hypothetical protein